MFSRSRFPTTAVVLFAGALLACDHIANDVTPAAPPEPSPFRTAYTLAGNDVTVALTATADGVTTYRVGSDPRFGRLSFLDNGYLLYRADSTVQEAEDQFTLLRTMLSVIKRDTIRIVIKPRPELLPCNAGAQADDAQTPLNTPVTIEVLANDRFCSGQVDPGSFKVSVPPKNGTTELKGFLIEYKPKSGFVGTDLFVYSYHLVGSTDVLAAIVRVRVGQPAPVNCQVALVNDAAVVKAGTPEVVLDVLKNDRLCDKPGTVSLKTRPLPSAGTASVNGANQVVFKPANAFTGTIDFTYQVCFANGAVCPTAVVKITVEAPAPGCKNHTETDNVTVKRSGGPVEIPVLTNDVLCSPAASLTVGKPLSGKTEVKGLQVFYTPPKSGESDRFTYEVTTVAGDKVSGTVQIKLVN